MPLLAPIQVRLTPDQFAGMSEIRAHDGRNMQEHIRRAVDYYLAAWRNARINGVAPVEATGTPVVPDHIASVVLEKPLSKRMKVVRR